MSCMCYEFLNLGFGLFYITESREEPIYCYTQMFTEDQSDSNKSPKHTSAVRLAKPVFKPIGARKVNIANGRALPNEYVTQMGQSEGDIEQIPEQSNLLPVIPEGTSTDSDHVRVLYTNQN